MTRRVTIWMLCLVAIVTWRGLVYAQTEKPGTMKTIKLSSGEEVYDLSGDWDAFNENYGEGHALFGIYPNVWRITQTGNTFDAIRMKNNPSPSPGRAGSPSLRGELVPNGFKAVWIIHSGGNTSAAKGQISEDGKKIVIDDGTVRVTLTRSDDRAPLVGMWRLFSFQREYQGTSERENPLGTATGYLLFLPEGRMAAVITGGGRKAPATDKDRAGLFNSLVAYTGPYRVDGDKWITTVEVSANPAWLGTEQVSSFQISGDRLQETTTWVALPKDRKARFVIRYDRMK